MPCYGCVAAGGARALKGGACAALRAPGGRERGNAPQGRAGGGEAPKLRCSGRRSGAAGSGAQRSSPETEPPAMRAAARARIKRRAALGAGATPRRANGRQPRADRPEPASEGRSERPRSGAQRRPRRHRTTPPPHAPAHLAPGAGAGSAAAYRVCWRRFKRRRQQPGRVPPAPLCGKGGGFPTRSHADTRCGVRGR